MTVSTQPVSIRCDAPRSIAFSPLRPARPFGHQADSLVGVLHLPSSSIPTIRDSAVSARPDDPALNSDWAFIHLCAILYAALATQGIISRWRRRVPVPHDIRPPGPPYITSTSNAHTL
jgi:hypothetical protein